jgi:hypothetical protein
MRLKVVTIALLALAATAALPAQVGEVIAARNALLETGATGDNVARAALLADDLTWVDRGGRLRNKQAELSEFKPGGTTRATEVDARRYGMVAVLMNRLTTADSNSVISLGIWHKTQKGPRWTPKTGN